MPVQIGDTTHSFSNPTGLLADCHRRVGMFMSALQSVAAVSDSPLSDDFRRSLDLALRYFREAAPKHTADEEESLFPRLRHVQSPETKEAFGKLDSLEEDHRWAEPLHKAADELGMTYLNQSSLSSKDAKLFRETVDRLADMYARHIQIEENDIFPIADRVLSKEQQEEIAREMATRRNFKPLAEIQA
jgi:hemerythrin-like domain-containing protein